MTAPDVDAPDLIRLGGQLGLQHPLPEVLLSSPPPCVVVFDGVEKFTNDAIALIARLVKEFMGSAGPKPCLLLTVQQESMLRVRSRLSEGGCEPQAMEPVELERPDVAAVGQLVSSVRTLAWAAFRPELRALLTNLKLLDWVVRATRTGFALGDGQPVTLTALVDRLWLRWVEGDGTSYARSGLLMKLGELEAATLADGVARTSLEFAEQGALAALVTTDLLRVRNERVRFAHDLLGDWSRLRILVGEGPADSADARNRAASPRWHRAVRLYGQRLLESGSVGPADWAQAVKKADDGSHAGRIVSDLLLEAVIFPHNARDLLEHAWSMLVADHGRLLARLLDRFLYVATVSNDRLSEIFKAPGEAARFEHLFRLPSGPYWRAMLETLDAHPSEVAVLCPGTGARLAALWLRSVPQRVGEGLRFPWRGEAARIALSVAQHVHRSDLRFDKDDARVAYEAVLLATPDLPDEVTAFCRMAAERVPNHAPADDDAEIRKAEAIGEIAKTDPERAEYVRRLTTPVFPLGPLRQPWPNGPLARVPNAFRGACLDTAAFPAFFQTRADAAVEVLLAVSIEEPQHEHAFVPSFEEDCGIERWHDGYPPLYFRGPFLVMFRSNPFAALTYALRLVNFATRRFVEIDLQRTKANGGTSQPEVGVWFSFNGERRYWLGDCRVYRWHHDQPPDSALIPCVLMALEFWLYEELTKGGDVSVHLAHIMAESESLAFAGLLIDVGKRYPSLFKRELLPLIANAEIFELDTGVATQRHGMSLGLVGWGPREPEEFVRMAREWHGLPHRKTYLREIAQWMLGQDAEFKASFADVLATWRAAIGQDANHRWRFLVEQLNPDNIVRTRVDDRHERVTVELPPALAAESHASGEQYAEEMLLMLTPMQCRMRLDKAEPVGADDLDRYWADLQRLAAMAPVQVDDYGLKEPLDAVLGMVAVLVVLHWEWLTADPARMDWCRRTLQAATQAPPARSKLDSPSSIGDHSWDGFAAEAGAALWIVDPSDVLARCLVASGLTAYLYSTVSLTLRRLVAGRQQLGDDFDRACRLAVLHGTVRAALLWCGSAETETAKWIDEANTLYAEFVEGKLSTKWPTISDENARVARLIAEARRVHEQVTRAFTGSTVINEMPTWYRHSRRREPHSFVLDARLLAATMTPLSPGPSAAAVEIEIWESRLTDLLDMVLDAAPHGEHHHDDLPNEFENWVFEQVAGLIPRLPPARARKFWQPLLALGVPGHRWVERFFWDWFDVGFRNAPTPGAFSVIWEEMIRFALVHPLWSIGRDRYDLAGIVNELLGFDHGRRSVAQDAAYEQELTRLIPTYAAAAENWFVLPRVANGCARFVTEPATGRLLAPAVHWLGAVIEKVAGDDHERDLDDTLIKFLHVVWERHRKDLAHDHMLKNAFEKMLTRLAAGGAHSALALRDRITSSITS